MSRTSLLTSYCDLLHLSSYTIVLGNSKTALRLEKIPDNFIILS